MSAKSVARGAVASPFKMLGDLGGKAVENADAIGRLVEGVRVAADAVREIAVRKTEQSRIRAQAEGEIARIHAVRDVMLDYLDRSFDERRHNFDALFTRLDAAMVSGDVAVIAKVLDTVVALARSSPFKDLADVATAKAALQDKNREWEF